MTIDRFLHGLDQRQLWLEVREAGKKLALCGDETHITEPIRSYIRLNREQLLIRLTQDERTLDCHLVYYGLCTHQVIEQNEQMWRLSPDGTLFCIQCWQSRHIERAERANAYLLAHDLPIALDERLALWQASGGQDWLVDEDGLLIDPALLTLRAENARLDQEHDQAERERKRRLDMPLKSKNKRAASAA